MPCSSRSRNSPIRRPILFELVAQRVDPLHELTEIPYQVVRILTLPLQPRNVLARYDHGPFGPLALFELRVFSELHTLLYSLFGLFYIGGVGVSCGESWIGAAASCSSTPASAVCLLGLRYLLTVVSSPLSGSVV